MRKGSSQRFDSIDLDHSNDMNNDYDDNNITPTQFLNPDEDDPSENKVKLPPLAYNNSNTNLNEINEDANSVNFSNRDEERSPSSLSNNSRVVLPKLDSRFLPK